jgi:hypothetical protein
VICISKPLKLIPFEDLSPPARSSPNKKIKYNKILTYIFVINISGNSSFGTPVLRKTPRDANGKGV